MSRSSTSLRALCEHVIHIASSDGAAAGAELRADLPTIDIVLELDPGKMEQVLLNLLRNAMEAVQATGGGLVVLRARRTPRHALVAISPPLNSANISLSIRGL